MNICDAQLKFKRLNIGSGHYPAEGCINMDWEYSEFKGVRTDVLGDAVALPFKSNSFSAVAIIHCIEHFTEYGGYVVLREAHRVLELGGKIIVESPDLIKTFMEYSNNPPLLSWMLYGDQKEIAKNEGMQHRWGYTPEYLRDCLYKIGFKDAVWEDGHVHGYPERDFKLWAVK